MRISRALALVALLPLVALAPSCGGGGTRGGFTGGNGDAGAMVGEVADLAIADLTPLPDLTIVKDLVGLLPQPCGNDTCAVGQKCCFTGNAGACMDSCPDGAFSFACYGPQDCAGNPCCLQLKNFKPTGLACTNKASACEPGYDIFGNDGQTRFCNVDADCTRGASGTSFDRCCTGMFMGQPGKICIDPALAKNAGLTCN